MRRVVIPILLLVAAVTVAAALWTLRPNPAADPEEAAPASPSTASTPSTPSTDPADSGGDWPGYHGGPELRGAADHDPVDFSIAQSA